MKFIPENPPRIFHVGRNEDIEINDCGKISLAPNEMVTFIDGTGNEYDVCRKEWGYYATPSINQRLANNGFRTALVKNLIGNTYIMLVNREGEEIFLQYLSEEGSVIICWLDDAKTISAIEDCIS